MTELIRSEKYESIVEELINEDEKLIGLRSEDAKVVCICSDKTKLDENKRRVYADIEKIPPKFQWATDADAMITIYEPNIAWFNEKQRKIVLLRELLKLVVDTIDNVRKVAILDYDLKDFRCIVEKYGANWDQTDSLFTEEEA